MVNKGHVYIVGAGPGDPDLITKKALILLARADVVLYDYLIPTNVLLECKEDAILECVGKKKGSHSKTQSFINERMAYYANKGLMVLRLKGGDPLTFGRGGEEMLFLDKENTPYTVVPGVSAAMAVPASVGIPLTHRELSRSVAFVTGTLHDGQFNQSMPSADTVVCLMALTGLEELMQHFKNNPRFTKDTPAALIQSGTTAQEKMIIGTLETLPKLQEAMQLRSPALLVVGEVVQLAGTLSWKQSLPLHGKRVVVLRTLDQAKEMYETLTSLGAEVVLAPMLDLLPIYSPSKPLEIELLKTITHSVFTSVNGVRFFINALRDSKIDIRTLSGWHITAIGRRTKEELEKNGIYSDYCPETSYSESILDYFKAQKSLSDAHILIPTTEKADDTLKDGLASLNLQVTRLNLYITTKKEKRLTNLLEGDIVLFTSASTVQFACETQFWTTQNIQAISIGDKTTAEILKYQPQSKVYTAQNTTSDAMLETLLKVVKQD